jgi:lycopene beta-cyclase
MGDYRYKMIRGIDFYEKCFSIIKQQPNVDIRYGDLQFVHQEGTQSRMFIDNVELLIADAVVFNSISCNPRSDKNTLKLMQHFKGWIIETNDKVFDTSAGTLMDFRVHQNHGTSFVYVMPLAANRALVEYTLFTEQLLAANEYDGSSVII